MDNILYFGDNLKILRDHIDDESVDLIYLDPPFNSNRDYNVIFKETTGEESEAQLQAFSDSWHWTAATQRALEEMTETASPKLVDLINGFISVLGQNDVTAYLLMMAIRLVELHRVLKPTGSLYLHCDPTASHYLKIVLDTIFGPTNFRNEIIWKRQSAHSSAKRWGDVHDTVLFYTKSNIYVWNSLLQSYDEAYLGVKYRYEDERGKYRLSDLTGAGTTAGDSSKLWRGYDPTKLGRHWAIPRGVIESHVGVEKWEMMTTQEKLDLMDVHGYIYWTPRGKKSDAGFPQYKRYLSKGMPIQDTITDIPPINSQAAERLGYPTQKPLALLERIIQASSNEGDLVLDPFCGCGTTIIAAQKLKRHWIGIDITHLAISLMKYRLHDTFGTEVKYRVEGEPADTASAYALAEKDRYQFQWWALSLIKARPVGDEKKKGADAGIDGTLYFIDDAKTPPKKIIVQVKSGKVQVKDIRELIQVVHRAKATMGFFITLDEPTEPMAKEALAEGFYKSSGWGKQYQKIQICTIAQLLAGEEFDMPPTNVSFKRAEKARQQANEEGLFKASKKQIDLEEE
ncbi:restriction endonuclease [Candidatus Acetothermia bacterium]|nr:restriction endonuclease [Candidatus Acetothermia bacterium]